MTNLQNSADNLETETQYKSIVIPLNDRNIEFSLDPEILLEEENLTNLFKRLMILCIDWSSKGWSRSNIDLMLKKLGFPEKYAEAIGVGFRMYMHDLTCQSNGEPDYNGIIYIKRKMSIILEDHRPLIGNVQES